MMLHSRKAQSVLEYTLILAVVLGVIIVAIFSGLGGNTVKASVEKAYEKSITALKNTVDNLTTGIFAP